MLRQIDIPFLYRAFFQKEKRNFVCSHELLSRRWLTVPLSGMIPSQFLLTTTTQAQIGFFMSCPRQTKRASITTTNTYMSAIQKKDHRIFKTGVILKAGNSAELWLLWFNTIFLIYSAAANPKGGGTTVIRGNCGKRHNLSTVFPWVGNHILGHWCPKCQSLRYRMGYHTLFTFLGRKESLQSSLSLQRCLAAPTRVEVDRA